MGERGSDASELFRDHLAWIQGLARALVADRHEADELAQEVCLAALRSGPRDPSRVRAWLGAVARNLRRQRGRAAARRRDHEQRTARPAVAPDGRELVERVAQERALAGLVLELEEPFRSALLLRYFEELPPAEIARRLAIPVATVHSRIARGLERLRARLGGREGLERRLALVLLPLALPARAPTSFVLGGLVVNAKLVLSAAAVALVLLGGLLVLRPTSGAAPEPLPVAPQAPPAAVAVLADEEPREPVRGLALADGAAALHAPPALAPARPLASVRRVEGRVFDADGAPLAGLAIAALDEPERTLATSGVGGRFTLETERGELTLVPTEPRTGSESEAGTEREWVEVRAATWRASSRLEPILVVARSLVLAGTVLDEDGGPLAGASLVLRLPAGFAARFPTSLEASESHGWRTRSDERGRFRWDAVPFVGGALLAVALEGYELLELPEPEASTEALTLVLRRPTTALDARLVGRVVDRGGRPVEGARVGVGLASVLSGVDGSFAVDLARAVTAHRVVAVKAAFQPAIVEREGLQGIVSAGGPPLELVLGDEALSIRGRVVDAQGVPRAGARVWIADPTRFGTIGRLPATLEGLMAGALVPPQALESELDLPAEDGDGFWDHTVPASAPSTVLWTYARADEHGGFVLEGLAPRDYRVATLDERTLQLFESEPVPAGASGVELVLPEVRLRARLGGRVVSSAGRPVPGVRVELLAQPFALRMRVFGGTSDVSFWQAGAGAITDAEGRFELTDVPRTPLFLTLESEEIVPQRLALAPDEDGVDRTLVVEALCRLEVALRPPLGRADAVALRDESGAPLDLLVFSRDSTNAYTSVPLVEGRSGWFAASSRARTLLLLVDGEPVEELSLDLVPGERRTLEP